MSIAVIRDHVSLLLVRLHMVPAVPTVPIQPGLRAVAGRSRVITGLGAIADGLGMVAGGRVLDSTAVGGAMRHEGIARGRPTVLAVVIVVILSGGGTDIVGDVIHCCAGCLEEKKRGSEESEESEREKKTRL